MQTISIINQKGGVGKSTTAQALAIGLVLHGYRCLLVDLDPQGNLTYSLQGKDSPSILDVLTRDISAQEAIQGLAIPHKEEPKTIDLIPSNPGLASIERILTQTGREYRLKEVLQPLQARYDFMVLDTPPALGLLTVNALTASNGVIIPALADIFSLQGIGQLSETIRTIQEYTNPGLQVLGILLTRHNERTILSKDITALMTETAQQMNTQVYPSRIREAVAVREAQASQIDLYSYAPRSNATEDYRAFVNHFLADLGR